MWLCPLTLDILLIKVPALKVHIYKCAMDTSESTTILKRPTNLWWSLVKHKIWMNHTFWLHLRSLLNKFPKLKNFTYSLAIFDVYEVGIFCWFFKLLKSKKYIDAMWPHDRPFPFPNFLYSSIFFLQASFFFRGWQFEQFTIKPFIFQFIGQDLFILQ